jgi:hypothetical protein
MAVVEREDETAEEALLEVKAAELLLSKMMVDGPARGSTPDGQSGYCAIKELEEFAGATGVWRLQEVYALVKAGNWQPGS